MKKALLIAGSLALGSQAALAGEWDGFYVGGGIAQSNLGLPAAAISLLQGMLLFFLLAVDVLTNYRVRFSNKVAA